jgi:hypothetical protein
MRILPGILVVFALLFTSGSAWADNKSIQGTVIGSDGNRLAGAEMRAERLDAKTAAAQTKTDAKGQYVFKGLPAGAYAITAIVKNVPKSRASVRTRSDGWARVDFDLRMRANDPSIKKQASKQTTSPVDAIGSDDVSRMQRSMGGNINNMSFPGH